MAIDIYLQENTLKIYLVYISVKILLVTKATVTLHWGVLLYVILWYNEMKINTQTHLMKIFLDTADTSQIKQYADWGIVDGVTTNPSLIAKEGVSPKQRIMEITELVDGPISVEVVAEDAETMIQQARLVASWHKNIYAKIPMTPEGLKAVKVLSAEGIHTNVTLVFDVTQALLAAKAGATLVSPFVGRLDDRNQNGIEMVQDIVEAFAVYGFETQILAASIRNKDHIKQALKVGVDIVTLPPKLLDEMVGHELTTKGMNKFIEDWNACETCQDMYQ